MANGERAGKENANARAEKMGPEQINLALTQAWTGFNSQVGRDFSTLTMNLPKGRKPEVSISFVDAIPQHERARNSAIFNYQTAEISKVELYEDKKLNEKIMSSMLPVHRGSFFGSVYQFLAMLASLAMPLFFVTGWMLYLKRRKQKRLTLAARASNTAVSVDPNAQPWLIAYASQTGVAEQLAWRTATSLQEARQPVTVKSVQQLSLSDLEQATQVLFVASTYGTGDAPDLASSFEKKILSSQANLSHLRYAVLALGSKEYPDSYCSFGHRIAAWLHDNQAHALFNTVEVDNANAEDIGRWNRALASATALELQAMSIEKVYDQWTLKQRELLNPNSLGHPAFNIELSSQQDMTWQAGDIAEIQPGNSLERIQAFLTAQGLHATMQVQDQTLAQALLYKDLTQVPDYDNSTDLVQKLSDLPAREYSIASIPAQGLLRLVVRQQQDATGQLGLGSGWLTAHAALEQEIALRIRTNASFHLIDDNRPIICIGNGTGIAGLMSLLQQRAQHGYHDNWLIFGERQRAHDFFYEDVLSTWQHTGMLKRLDLAFSRDQAEKRYVHHVLREQAAELKTWIAQGAVIYVCGSIQGMATDVDHALIDLLGETQVDALRQAGRYRRDVY